MSTPKNAEKLSRQTSELLSSRRFTPKKKLGQNFMIDPVILERMTETACLSKDDLVLEIGTGTGILTGKIAERSGFVVSIEYDKVIIEIAREELKSRKNIELVREDFLKLNIPEILKKYPGFKGFKVVANLPYYITAPIIEKLTETRPAPRLLVLTVQREVAERITAKPGGKSCGSFSVYVQYHFEPEIVSFIPKSAFIPHPAVSSAIITLRPREKPPVKIKSEKKFFGLVRSAFEHRRKTLKNAILLSQRINISKEDVDKALLLSGIDGERRGETLTMEEFGKLSDLF